MARHVCLRDPDGSFYDPEDGFHVVRSGIEPLPDRICRRTEQALNKGILIDAEPPRRADTSRSDPEQPETELDLGEGTGQSQPEALEGAADKAAHADPVEQAAPASTKKPIERRSRKKAAKA